jgi:CheY-like chemotaxis protein
MATKLALVVDDSRMARHMLSKMLTEQGIEVDTVESGEEALGYLCGKKPSMIFMDHTMPGMDGFQTLRAIKNDPHTAAIPIIMYTSKEGEVYESQARALGAVDVIPKTLKPLQLAKVLERQNLLPGQASQADEAIIAAPAANDVIIVENESPIRSVFENYREEKAAGTRPAQKSAELQELEERIHALTQQLQDINQPAPPSRGRGYRLQYLGLALCVVLIGFLLLNNTRLSHQVSEVRMENLELKKSFNDKSSEADTVRSQLETRLDDVSSQTAVSNRRLFESIEWALNQEGRFDFGEKPFNDKLAATLAQLVENLASVGFTGNIAVRSHLGRFCATTDETGEMVLPEEGQPMSTCEVVDFSGIDIETVGNEQTAVFAGFLSAFESQYGDDMRMTFTTAGDRRPLVRYPAVDPDTDASRWNEAASRNQRIEISINPG